MNERAIIVRSEPHRLRTSFCVSVEPRTIDQPSRWTRDRAAALRIADEISAATGWPVEDRTGDKVCS
jgi:hypothetical protein